MTAANYVEAVSSPAVYLSEIFEVTVPSIGDNDTGEVAEDVTAASTFVPVVGDGVIAIPLAALPTDCTLTGAWVSDTQEVTVGFSAQNGAVTGAGVNFRFLYFDLTKP